MSKIKYDYRNVLSDLAEHGVDLKSFEAKVRQMSGGVLNQSMVEVVYETLVLNNYRIELLMDESI